MSDVKHTPGPWTLEFEKDGSGEWIIRSADGDAMMGNADYYPWQSGNVRDAHLIAAAPEMLEALEDVVSRLVEAFPGMEVYSPVLRAEAAISKAKGINPDE